MARAGRGRLPRAEMDAARVVNLLAHLQARSLSVWLDGGWAVDALLGEQTRPHDDLDLVARLEDSEHIEQALGEAGYLLAGGGPPLSFELVDDVGHQVDIHPASITPVGDGIYRMASGETWVYPAAGFYGVGSIVGHAVPCLTPEVLIVNHTTGYALDEDHQRDVLAIAERFGIPVPEFETA
jgi:lincosamide nucleotidyltransferase A/C/D/E